ncbi:DNA helicase IV [Vibrio sp. MA40-2]|uniref:DNA helicase IV n=1 Tax=Vibrio sp. MA40-2 TaxID=3391828 RepID=UPI0039A600E1
MELKASDYAQFFIQKQYNQVAIEDNYLVISSNDKEERIPFSVWNGEVVIERGLVWGTLTFNSYVTESHFTAWIVQGLPWQNCKQFASQATHLYRQWHNQQCKQLNQCQPKWQEELNILKKQPAYLPDSQVYVWRDEVLRQLNEMNLSLEDAEQRIPKLMDELLPWLVDIETVVDERNELWLQNERVNWEVLFSQIESSPLNISQQHAVLLNNDYNLILAGAGTGKTSVLTARIAYLLQSHLAQPEQLLMLAFGKDAAKEMQQRLKNKIGSGATAVTVNTFHQLGLKIINTVEDNNVQLSPYATDSKLKRKWCSDWLKDHWTKDVNLKRWRKHLSVWPIAFLQGDEELASQSENSKLLAWIETQLDQLCSVHRSKKYLQQQLIDQDEYPKLNSELSLIWPCYVAWQAMLKESGHIDFYTMITRATEYIVKGKFCSPWRYIMVDEYQDISPDRIALVEALCRNQKGETLSSLFAVGDDWQSIYQFAGSDVDLTTGFAQRFASSSIHSLDMTYRFNSKIADVANQFIQQNPNQLEKEFESVHLQQQNCVTICHAKKIEKWLDQLNRIADRQKSVLLLGRNHSHKPDLLSDWKRTFTHLNIEFMTCHASKGKEADYVFILSVDEGQLPAKTRQRHLNSVLCESSDDYPFAEERRLFYVAMTRAKQQVWITYNISPSPFITELLSADYAIVNQID